jgi:oligoribonuclease NrnB/cAMP/cGMP phosphodiesterase (DHH superfamily)
MIQTALQPEIKKLDTWRTKNEKTLKEISTTVEANHKFCSDLNKRNVPKELQTLQKWINKVESNNSKTDERTMILEQIVKNMREDDDALYDDVKRCIGPIKQAHITMKETVLERIEYLEDKSKSLRSDQDVLSGGQNAYCAY